MTTCVYARHNRDVGLCLLSIFRCYYPGMKPIKNYHGTALGYQVMYRVNYVFATLDNRAVRTKKCPDIFD